jgi:hypothetical protein
MIEPVASTYVLDAPAEICPATLWRLNENGFALPACRGTGENSNSAIVNTPRRSKLLPWLASERVKSSPLPRAYFGITPNACSKRLT